MLAGLNSATSGGGGGGGIFPTFTQLLGAAGGSAFSSLAHSPPTPSNMHRCCDCDFSDTTARKLSRHRAVAHGDCKFKCPHCAFTTAYQSNYHRHMRQYHQEEIENSPDQRLYPCDRCDFKTTSQEGLNIHRSQMHKDAFTCVECGDCFANKAHYAEHLRCAHLPTAAELCDAVDNTRDVQEQPLCLVTSMRQSRDTTERQPKSGESAELSGVALEEEEAEEESKLEIVDVENNDRPVSEELEQSERRRCPQCDFESVHPWNLQRHIVCHEAEGQFTCRRCRFSVDSRQAMLSHLENGHKTVERRSVSCQSEASWGDLESEGMPAVEVQVDHELFNVETHAMYVRSEDDPPTEGQRPKTADVQLSATNFEVSTAANPSAATTTPTLDQLVVQKALQSSTTPRKMYLSEADAIETPQSDEDLLIGGDPDVESRVCSVCGYKGKWISEMLRHKRVHTSDRPFKCKYCSRTSKWKADLIRHVAKVHGIRVVSKYSRTKAFDVVKFGLKSANSPQKCSAPSPAQSPPLNLTTTTFELQKRDAATFESADEPSSLESKRSRRESSEGSVALGRTQWCCNDCRFVHTSRAVLVDHLKNVHDRSLGGFSSDGKADELLTVVTMGDGAEPTSNDRKALAAESLSSLSSRPSTSSLDASPAGSEAAAPAPCPFCPFVAADSPVQLQQHLRDHEAPKGLINYKCVFCNFYRRKKAAIVEHMRLHTDDVDTYSSEINKNMISSVASSGVVTTLEREVTGPSPTAQDEQVDVDSRSTSSGSPPLDEDYEDADAPINFDDYLFAKAVPKDIQKVSTVHGPMWQCRFCKHNSRRRANIRLHEKTHFKPTSAGFIRCPKCVFKGELAKLNEHYAICHMDERRQKNATAPLVSSAQVERAALDDFRRNMLLKNLTVAMSNELAAATAAAGALPNGPYGMLPSMTFVPPVTNMDFVRSLLAAAAGVALQAPLSCEKESNGAALGKACSPPAKKKSSAPKCAPTSASGSPSPVVKPKKYKCTNCPAKFSDNTQLNRHLRCHGDKQKHNCPKCDYSVPYPINLVKHLRSHHDLPIIQMKEMEVLEREAALVGRATNETDAKTKVLQAVGENKAVGRNEHCPVTTGAVVVVPSSDDQSGSLND